MDWTQIKHFKPEEFDSPDSPGSGVNMDESFIKRLDAFREYLGQPILVNSGFRTTVHNALVGGVTNSAHMRGLAVDIATDSLEHAIKVAIAAARFGWLRIGVSLKGKLVHVDQDPTLPTPATWFYS